MQNFKDYVNSLKLNIGDNDINKLCFVCIGTTDVIWDSLGPIVGTFLEEKIGKNNVIGNIKNNICNEKDLRKYRLKINNKSIIAIDTAIVGKDLHGEIFISKKPITMGLALNKPKGKIGNISIKVAIKKDLPKKEIINMAKFVENGIINAIEKT